jgi:hypothetical protein
MPTSRSSRPPTSRSVSPPCPGWMNRWSCSTPTTSSRLDASSSNPARQGSVRSRTDLWPRWDRLPSPTATPRPASWTYPDRASPSSNFRTAARSGCARPCRWLGEATPPRTDRPGLVTGSKPRKSGLVAAAVLLYEMRRQAATDGHSAGPGGMRWERGDVADRRAWFAFSGRLSATTVRSATRRRTTIPVRPLDSGLAVFRRVAGTRGARSLPHVRLGSLCRGVGAEQGRADRVRSRNASNATSASAAEWASAWLGGRRHSRAPRRSNEANPTQRCVSNPNDGSEMIHVLHVHRSDSLSGDPLQR